MKTSRMITLVVVTAASLALTACDPTEPESTPTEAVGPETSPGPTPEPTAEVDPHPDLADLIISTSGLGPLTVGQPPATNPGAEMIEWDEDFCSGDFFEGDDPGRWVASGYGSDTNYYDEPTLPAFYVEADDSAVYRVDVMGNSPHTKEGIRIGSTLEELQATYPDRQGPYAGPVSQVWWLQDANGYLVFETQGEDMLGPGAVEQVILIRVLATSYETPQWAAANSGNVAGACF